MYNMYTVRATLPFFSETHTPIFNLSFLFLYLARKYAIIVTITIIARNRVAKAILIIRMDDPTDDRFILVS